MNYRFDSTGNRTRDLPHTIPALCRFGYRAGSSDTKLRMLISRNDADAIIGTDFTNNEPKSQWLAGKVLARGSLDGLMVRTRAL